MIAVLMKLEMSTPQKVKIYSVGMLLGLSRYFAITAMMIARITLVMAETTEAAI